MRRAWVVRGLFGDDCVYYEKPAVKADEYVEYAAYEQALRTIARGRGGLEYEKLTRENESLRREIFLLRCYIDDAPSDQASEKMLRDAKRILAEADRLRDERERHEK